VLLFGVTIDRLIVGRQFERQVVATAQRGCAAFDEGGNPSRRFSDRRCRPVCCDPIGRTNPWPEVSPINVRDAGEIDRAVAAFARGSDGGLIVTASALAIVNRAAIIALAARHRLPTVYYRRIFVANGGLISYGPDLVDPSRRAAGYVDRILKGESPPICRCRRRRSTSW
jgi:hypothetical protein